VIAPTVPTPHSQALTKRFKMYSLVHKISPLDCIHLIRARTKEWVFLKATTWRANTDRVFSKTKIYCTRKIWSCYLSMFVRLVSGVARGLGSEGGGDGIVGLGVEFWSLQKKV
jgi:hypothetical protein